MPLKTALGLVYDCGTFEKIKSTEMADYEPSLGAGTTHAPEENCVVLARQIL